MFTDYSSPSMHHSDGTPVGRGINHIRETDGVITFDFMHDRLSTPQDITVTDITANTFTASWSASEGAVSYEVKVTEILPDEEQTLRLKEEFSLMKKGEYPKSDYENIADKLDSYTETPGWSGADLYQTGGEVRIGSYGVSGYLQTPTFAMHAGKPYTVALTVQSYTGKSVNYTIEVIDGETGEVYQEAALKATKTLTDIILAGDEAHAVTYIKISTQNERLFLDRIRVLTGTYTEDVDIWAIGETERVITGITGTLTEISDLKPERTYIFTVKAIAEEELMNSPESQPVTVVTPPIASIRDITQGKAEIIGIYDIYGRGVSENAKGMLIIKYSDGATVKTIR